MFIVMWINSNKCQHASIVEYSTCIWSL